LLAVTGLATSVQGAHIAELLTDYALALMREMGLNPDGSPRTVSGGTASAHVTTAGTTPYPKIYDTNSGAGAASTAPAAMTPSSRDDRVGFGRSAATSAPLVVPSGFETPIESVPASAEPVPEAAAEVYQEPAVRRRVVAVSRRVVPELRKPVVCCWRA
jgi:hypothetical protein